MCDCKTLKYCDTSTLQYTQASKLNLDQLCNAVTIKNAGNIICLVDDEPIQPGESKSFQFSEMQIFYGRHQVGFTTAGMAVVPAILIPSAWVTQTFYIDTPKGVRTELK
jgi:hypothetical protein